MNKVSIYIFLFQVVDSSLAKPYTSGDGVNFKTLRTKDAVACVASVCLEQRAKNGGFRRFARAKTGARAK